MPLSVLVEIWLNQFRVPFNNTSAKLQSSSARFTGNCYVLE